MDDKTSLDALYLRYINNDLNQEELKDFLEIINHSKNANEALELLEETWHQTVGAKVINLPVEKRELPEKKRWFNWQTAIAVCCVISLSAAMLYLFIEKDSKQISEVADLSIQVKEIPNKTTLITENGETINIDAVKNGSTMAMGNAEIVKNSDGVLSYQTTSPVIREEYFTMQTPKGSNYRLALADGTQVWLNGASSIRFPNVFLGKEREVSITGEVYFEVARNKEKPFIVKTKEMKVQVLGTSFNISAYEEESVTRTTLVEGSVKVLTQKDSAILKPGQEASIRKEKKYLHTEDVNIDQTLAWKNGTFRFKDTDIKTIMREVSRWYDVEVEFVGKADQHFTGIISRDATVEEFLLFLQETEAILFKIDGKKIIVE